MSRSLMSSTNFAAPSAGWTLSSFLGRSLSDPASLSFAPVKSPLFPMHPISPQRNALANINQLCTFSFRAAPANACHRKSSVRKSAPHLARRLSYLARRNEIETCRELLSRDSTLPLYWARLGRCFGKLHFHTRGPLDIGDADVHFTQNGARPAPPCLEVGSKGANLCGSVRNRTRLRRAALTSVATNL